VIRGPEIRTKQSVIHRERETNFARTAETAENLTRTGSMPDGSIGALLQFIHGAGTAALGSCCLHHSFGRRFNLVSMVSINLGIQFYEVETGDAGESIEREESQ
jgi:hypothetical protein